MERGNEVAHTVTNPVIGRWMRQAPDQLVRYTVPHGAVSHAGNADRKLPPYLAVGLHFSEKKLVWLYVHGPNVEELRGRTIVARVATWTRLRKRTNVDTGETTIIHEDYVDLTYVRRPDADEKLHRMFVIASTDGALKQASNEGWFCSCIFHAPVLVVIAPEDNKYTAEKGFHIPPAKLPKELFRNPTTEPGAQVSRASTRAQVVDPLLQRYIRDGWELVLELMDTWRMKKINNAGGVIIKEFSKPKKIKHRKLCRS